MNLRHAGIEAGAYVAIVAAFLTAFTLPLVVAGTFGPVAFGAALPLGMLFGTVVWWIGGPWNEYERIQQVANHG